MDPKYEPYWTNYLLQFDLPAEHFQNIPSPAETNKFCVIVEPRVNSLLLLVIKNFMTLLQNRGWGLIIFHGNLNGDFLKEGLAGWKNVIYHDMKFDNINAHIYNEIFTNNHEYYLNEHNPKFWKYLFYQYNCHHCLIFQMDTLLLKPDIDDFLEYGYVGAPFSQRFFGNQLDVGNGGLSLRKTETMMYIVDNCDRYPHLYNEDVFFCYWMKEKNMKLAPFEVAKEFSVEAVFYEDPCGLHKPLFEHERYDIPEDELLTKEQYIHLLSKKTAANNPKKLDL
jgi:hypothetical protein